MFFNTVATRETAIVFSENGNLTLRGNEIIQTSGILVESGGNLNIDSNDKD